MKVTTKLKNLKDHIIGYFNRELGFNGIITENITTNKTVYFCDKQELDEIKKIDNALPIVPNPFSIVVIRNTSGSSKYMKFTKHLKNKFILVLYATGQPPSITANPGSSSSIEAGSACWLYTPVKWDDSEIHDSTVYKKVGTLDILNPYYTEAPYNKYNYNVYDSFPRNDI